MFMLLIVFFCRKKKYEESNILEYRDKSGMNMLLIEEKKLFLRISSFYIVVIWFELRCISCYLIFFLSNMYIFLY